MAAVNLGRIVATRAVRLWLGPRELDQERRMEMSELVRRRVPGLRAQRGVERQFEQIADAVAARLEPMLVHEFRGLDEAGRQAALDGVKDAFVRADLSDEAVLGSDADPVELARRVRATMPAPVGLDEPAAQYHEVLFAECCDCYVRILRSLPVFTERAVAELLGRVSSLAAELTLVLERLPVRSLYGPQGADHDEAFRREYLGLVSRSLDEVELFSFAAGHTPRTKLSVAYVSLRVSTDDERAARQITRSAPLVRAGVRAWEDADADRSGARVEAVLAKSSRLLLRGEAGSGKTTLLRWIAVTAARGAFAGRLAEWNGLIPVVIKLRQHAGRELPRLEALLDHVAGPLTGHMPDAWLDRQFAAGRVLLLVDGVDELLAAERRRVREWLRLLLHAYPANRVVVTSRPAAARGDWLKAEGFTAAVLERMTPQDISAFVHQWHQAVREQGSELPCAPEELPHYERALMTSLQDRPHLQSLAANPLLAALLCALHLNRRRQLPRNRMELYRIALEILVQRRDADRGVPSARDVPLGLTDKLCVLQDLAWRLSDNNRSEISADKALAHVTAKVASMRHLDGDGYSVLDHLLARSGILRSPAEGRIDFLHRTFQEYLAAAEAAAEDRIGNLIGRSHLDPWRETIVMTAGHANRGQRRELVNGILTRARTEQRHARGLRLLAASCLETMESVPDDLAGQLDSGIGRVLPPRRTSDAVSLAAVGEPLLRRLPASLQDLGAVAAATAVRTAALIGGDSALNLLAGYTEDRRPEVHTELVEAWEYFDPDVYANRVLSRLPLKDVMLVLKHPSQWTAAGRLREARQIHVSYPFESSLRRISELPELDLLWIPRIVNDNDLAPLRDRPGLARLAFATGTPELPLNDLTPLTSLTALTNCQLQDWTSLPPVEELPLPTALTGLGLGKLSEGIDLGFVNTYTSLYFLGLQSTGRPRGLASWEIGSSLQRLELTGFDLTQDLELLSSVAPHLHFLTLWNCTLPTDLTPLATLGLVELKLGHCHGPDDAPIDLSPLAHPEARPKPEVELVGTRTADENRRSTPGIRIRRR
ncbi:NACHT domain-containing protein [Streptomyces lunaelactis]|uniref:NACHT domain-containing protein n=1 Tax=Streptomyces lunaelactis TaxID=1535768 RepID=UPI001C3088ED